jgi:hypothetical protein
VQHALLADGTAFDVDAVGAASEPESDGDSAVLSERERTIPTEFEPTASAV